MGLGEWIELKHRDVIRGRWVDMMGRYHEDIDRMMLMLIIESIEPKRM